MYFVYVGLQIANIDDENKDLSLAISNIFWQKREKKNEKDFIEKVLRTNLNFSYIYKFCSK